MAVSYWNDFCNSVLYICWTSNFFEIFSFFSLLSFVRSSETVFASYIYIYIYIYIFSKNFKRYSFCISFHTEGVFSRRWQSPPPLLNTHHGLAICITPKLCQHKLYSNGCRCSISPLDTLHLLNTLSCMDLCFKVTFIITKWSFTSIILWHFQ